MAIITYPHDPLTQLASNLWVVSAKTSQSLTRRMTVVRDGQQGLFIHDPLWLDDKTFTELDALGAVKAIFVPSWLHDFDAQRFAARYPQARFCGTRSAVKRLKWPRFEAYAPSMALECVSILELPGLRNQESACEVRHPEGGISLVFNDALFNQSHGRGFTGWLFKAIGSTGPLHMTFIGRTFLLQDRGAFKDWLAAQVARDDVKNVIVAHGTVVTTDAKAMLAGALAQL